MSSVEVRRDSTPGLNIAQHEDVLHLAKKYIDSELGKKMFDGNLMNLVIAMEATLASGLPVVEVFGSNGVFVTPDGKIGHYASNMARLVWKAGHFICPPEYIKTKVKTDSGDFVEVLTGCKVTIFRKEDTTREYPFVGEFTTADATRAGLTGKGATSAWHKYSKDLLYARALSRAIRQACPDALAGTGSVLSSYEVQEIYEEEKAEKEREELLELAAKTEEQEPISNDILEDLLENEGE